jgi:hypothetical protein
VAPDKVSQYFVILSAGSRLLRSGAEGPAVATQRIVPQRTKSRSFDSVRRLRALTRSG